MEPVLRRSAWHCLFSAYRHLSHFKTKEIAFDSSFYDIYLEQFRVPNIYNDKFKVLQKEKYK